jgi:hypothetical protein
MDTKTAAAKKPHPDRALQSVEVVVSVELGGGALGMVVEVVSEDVVAPAELEDELENPLELVEVACVLVPKDELDDSIDVTRELVEDDVDWETDVVLRLVAWVGTWVLEYEVLDSLLEVDVDWLFEYDVVKWLEDVEVEVVELVELWTVVVELDAA